MKKIRLKLTLISSSCCRRCRFIAAALLYCCFQKIPPPPPLSPLPTFALFKSYRFFPSSSSSCMVTPSDTPPCWSWHAPYPPAGHWLPPSAIVNDAKRLTYGTRCKLQICMVMLNAKLRATINCLLLSHAYFCN